MRPALLLAACLVLAGCYTETAQGEQLGTVSHFGTEGVFFTTWQGELSLGVMQGGTGSTNKGTEHFCVLDPEVAKQVAAATHAGMPLRVFYKEFFSIPPWRCDNGNLVIERIEPLLDHDAGAP